MNHLSATFRNSAGVDVPFEYWEGSSKLYDTVAILLHGLGYRATSYLPLVQHLIANKTKVYAFDLAGHGGRAETAFESVDKATDELESFRRHVVATEGYREIVLIGHSLGAVVALAYPGRYPDLKLRMVAVAPLFGSPLLGGASPDPAAYSFEEPVVESLKASGLKPNIAEAGLESVKKALAALTADGRPLKNTKALVLYGDSDPMAPYAAGEEALGKIQFLSKELKTFPRMKHDPFSERRKDQVFDTITAWLDRTRFEHQAP